MKIGNSQMLSGASITGLKPEELEFDPTLESLIAEQRAMFWYNFTEDKYKYFNGTEIRVMGGEELPTDLLKSDGTVGMNDGADFLLGGVDQTASDPKAAISKGHLDTALTAKQDALTGAATSIASADLTADVVLVSDATGKVAVSTTTAAELGHVAGVTSPLQAQIDGKQASLGYVPLNKAGDTLDGSLNANGKSITGLPAPVNPTDAARQIDLQNAMAGLNWMADVEAVQTDDTLDPTATPAEGVRYIITNPASLHANFGTIAGLEANDIVAYQDAEFVVVFDANVADQAQGNILWSNASNGYMRIEGTVGVDQQWVAFGGLAGVNAGIGLKKTGNTLDVTLGGGLIENGNGLITTDLLTDGGLELVDTGDGLAENFKLAMKLDGATLAKSATGTKVAAGGITEIEIAASALGFGLTGGDGTKASVAVKTDGGLAVDATGVSIDHAKLEEQVLYKTGGQVQYVSITDAPTDDAHGTNKLYVDTAVNAVSSKLNDTVHIYDATGAGDTALAVHTFTHGAGTRFGSVTVFEDTGYQIIPDEVICVDENTVRVELTQPRKLAIAFVAKNVA